MKNKFYMRVIVTMCSILLFAINTYAQTPNETEMADVMRSNGKIYVVITVLLVIFATLAAYLFSIDRRIKKLEDKV